MDNNIYYARPGCDHEMANCVILRKVDYLITSLIHLIINNKSRVAGGGAEAHQGLRKKVTFQRERLLS